VCVKGDAIGVRVTYIIHVSKTISLSISMSESMYTLTHPPNHLYTHTHTHTGGLHACMDLHVCKHRDIAGG
jgi:hypothetical protein